MPSNTTSSGNTASSGTNTGEFTYTSSGTNDQVCLSLSHVYRLETSTLICTNPQGNHYCSRDYGTGASNQNSYHYSNNDGSYYYSNPNGSTYCKFFLLSDLRHAA